jgi:RND family efflux transporter MFP subunit
MKTAVGFFVIGLCVAVAMGDDSAGDNSDQSVATVQTAVIRSGTITEKVTVYGSVTTQPGAVKVVSLPIEARVVRMRVAAGSAVAKETGLLDVEPSLAEKLQWQDAKNKLDAAKKDLANIQQRFNLKLATNSDLLAAQQAVDSAQLTVESFQQRGVAGGTQTLHAEQESLVSKIDVQEGQIVPAGTALIELIPKNGVGVRLGIEPSIVRELRNNPTVQLFLTDQGAPIPAKIINISQQINAESRLVDVFVEPAQTSGLMLDSFVRGEIGLSTKQTLIVPRDALLPLDEDYSLFTVKAGHAAKHVVKVIAENDNEAAISGEDLHTGDTVITQGNLELDDGTAVTAEGKQ